MDGSLSYCTIMQLEQYCQHLDKGNEICYVKAFVSLYSRILSEKENCLMGQKREVASKPLPDGKTQEEGENEDINLINILNPGDQVLVAGGASLPLLSS